MSRKGVYKIVKRKLDIVGKEGPQGSVAKRQAVEGVSDFSDNE
jgi:hypothetical protein